MLTLLATLTMPTTQVSPLLCYPLERDTAVKPLEYNGQAEEADTWWWYAVLRVLVLQCRHWFCVLGSLKSFSLSDGFFFSFQLRSDGTY